VSRSAGEISHQDYRARIVAVFIVAVMNAAVPQQLSEYFDRIGKVLGRKDRRELFAIYALGIFGDGARKSIERIAAGACTDPARAGADHQRLLHFALDSPWRDQEVRREAARYAIDAMTVRAPIDAWIIGDTDFPKQGSHSVGVHRQATGPAGKIMNCQVGVSLAVATAVDQLPLDFALYLPATWTQDQARRQEARIPDDVQFATKSELALSMLRRAIDARIPAGIVLADVAYGTSRGFRDGVRELGLHYAVAVDAGTAVRVFDKLGRRHDEVIRLDELATRIESQGGFRRCTWQREPPQVRFALRRILEAREPLWLLIEWRDGEREPAGYFLCSLPELVTKKRLVHLVRQRGRTERIYEDLKGELGLDHYEGRRFPGWHHHVSVVLCCYAFVVAERARSSRPPAAGARQHEAQPVPA
jgi:SRSO17 transposase